MTICNVFFDLEQSILGLNAEQSVLGLSAEQNILDFNVECVIDQPVSADDFLLQESGDYILQENDSKIKL